MSEQITAERRCPDCDHLFTIQGDTRWHNDAALQYQLDTLLREHADVCPKTKRQDG